MEYFFYHKDGFWGKHNYGEKPVGVQTIVRHVRRGEVHMPNTIKYYDARQWFLERQPKRAKLPAVLVAAVVPLLTSAVAGLLVGLLVGLCFPATFWYWAIGIAGISLPYILMDRVQVRLYHGYVKGKPYWTLVLMVVDNIVAVF